MRDLFGDKVERAIELLRIYQPKDRPYYGCFSGGKDSCVIKEIARLGNINVTWHYNVTTIDPPELCRFIKKFHSDVIWEIPKENFFVVAERKGFPTRKARWCCEVFKESRSPSGSVMIFGVRAAESPRRAKAWKEVTAHTKTGQYVVAPILNWSDAEIWQFIKSKNIPYCDLYDKGFNRLGCVGCPMSRRRKYDLKRWPHYERAWKRLFDTVWNKRTGTIQRDGRQWFGDAYFGSGAEMYEWWLTNEGVPKQDECQGILDMYS
jgi:phosphoadenosine phosphosulfate reductase